MNNNITVLLCILVLVSLHHNISGLQCYYCDNGLTEADCTKRIDTCAIDQNVCYTEVRNTSDGQVSIKKSCYQDQACHTLNQQNGHSCPAVCSLCCTGDLCNERGPDFCTCNLQTQTQPLISRIQTRRRDTTTQDPCINLPRVELSSPRFNCDISESITILGECTSISSIGRILDGKNFLITDQSDDETFLQCSETSETTTSTPLDQITRGRVATIVLELECILRNYNETSVLPFANTERNLEGLTIYCQNIGFTTKAYSCPNRETTLRCFVAYEEPQRTMLSSAVTQPNFLQSPFNMPTVSTAEPTEPNELTELAESHSPTTTEIPTPEKIGINSTAVTIAIASTGGLKWWIFLLIGLAALLLLIVVSRVIFLLLTRRGIYHVNKISPTDTQTTDDINTGELPG